ESLGPGAGEYDHADRFFLSSGLESGLQAIQGGRVEGVQLVRTVDGEDTHRTVVGAEEYGFGHWIVNLRCVKAPDAELGATALVAWGSCPLSYRALAVLARGPQPEKSSNEVAFACCRQPGSPDP